MLRGLDLVVYQNWEKIDDARLTKTLMKVPVGLWKTCASRPAQRGGSSLRSTPLAGHIVTLYNGWLGLDKMLSLGETA